MSGHESSDAGGPPGRGFADLWAAAVCTAVTGVVVFAPGLSSSPARPVLGLLFVLVVPGYAFVAALFPERGHTGAAEGPGDDGATTGIDWLERLVLSFGASVAVVPLVGLALNFTPWGIRLVPVFVALAGLTMGLVLLAAVRRRRLAPAERLRVPTTTVSRVRNELLDPEDATDGALNALLAVSLLVAASSVAFAVAVPTGGESFTEFYALTENESGGLAADDYPENLTVGDTEGLVVGVANHEGEPTAYTLVVELQNVSVVDGDVRVRDASTLRTLGLRVAPGETWRRNVTFTPERTGRNLRLAYYLYTGSGPVDGDDAAYRSLHLWVNVTDSPAARSERLNDNRFVGSGNGEPHRTANAPL